jgi:hypothetical protein
LVEAFSTHASIERLDEGIVRRRAGSTERQFDATMLRPDLQRLGGKLRAIVDLENLGRPMPLPDMYSK